MLFWFGNKTGILESKAASVGGMPNSLTNHITFCTPQHKSIF